MIRQAFFLLFCASPVAAQTISDCTWIDSPDAIVEPWADHSRTFANGAVRLTLIDMIEPAGGALHLMLLSPPNDELGARQCRIISRSKSIGWVAIDFQNLQTGYDANSGLTFTLPARLYEPNTDFSNAAEITITLNQTTGAVDATQALGRD